jgi:hypothetical protein
VVTVGEITAAHSEKFDALREAYEVPGPLTLLELTGKSPEGVNTFQAVATIERGWFPKAARGTDGSAYTKLQIADIYEDLRELIDGSGNTGRTTHYAFGGVVRTNERDQILRPVSEPLIWELRGYETHDTYAD